MGWIRGIVSVLSFALCPCAFLGDPLLVPGGLCCVLRPALVPAPGAPLPRALSQLPRGPERGPGQAHVSPARTSAPTPIPGQRLPHVQHGGGDRGCRTCRREGPE